MQNTRTDQSTTILMLGIFSWVLSCCSIGWVLAIVGTILGYQELKEFAKVESLPRIKGTYRSVFGCA